MIANCFIQARSNSTRLPGKIMMPINGIPLAIRLYRRLSEAANIRRTVILMPHGDPALEQVSDFANVFLGEMEIAQRFIGALEQNPCNGFVRVCADSPFLTPDLVDLAAEASLKRPYTLVSGGRSGLQCEGFRTQDFRDAEPCMTGEEREHLGLFFQRGHSLAIDTAEDYERLKDIPL